MNQTTLDTIAPSMDHDARELAHGRCSIDDSPDEFIAAYIRALTELCGAYAVSECSDGETFEPADFLPGDVAAITEACALCGVTPDWKGLRAYYLNPGADARAIAY